MAARAGEDEQMPDKMRIAHAFPRIEQHACRISDSTSDKPEHHGKRNGQRKRPDKNESEPAHSQIKSHRKFLVALSAACCLDQYAKGRQCPDKPQHRPTPNSSKRTQRKGSVRSGN